MRRWMMLWAVAFLCLTLLAGCSEDEGRGQTGEPEAEGLHGEDGQERPDGESQNGESLQLGEEALPMLEEVDFSTYFDGLEGTAVLLHSDGSTYVYNRELAETAVSPCSTFKIASTLMILETGAVDPEEKLVWDGTGWRFPQWNQDISLKDAYRSSCVWYYRQGIDRIGPEYVQDRLLAWNYGNCDISQWEGSDFNGIATADGFWIESSLLISPLEQVAALRTIFAGDSAEAVRLDALKEIMRDDSLDSPHTLYGKTGSGRGAWYVGIFEPAGAADPNELEDGTWEKTGAGAPVYFAIRLAEQEGVVGTAAKEIAIDILMDHVME